MAPARTERFWRNKYDKIFDQLMVPHPRQRYLIQAGGHGRRFGGLTLNRD